jgi:hypothetical protein
VKRIHLVSCVGLALAGCTPAPKVTVSLPSGQDAGGTVQSVRTPDEQAGQEPMIEAVIAIDQAGAYDGPVRVRPTVGMAR